ncbi:hypothetical protein SIM91_06475 [Rhodococcus opacus]|uniref:hypothetical protein n=1 Tax=Rhodococcus opacus TaxID=37919 RepID=UPI0002A3BA94|nr:hypothetical protein [Rhodococcus opacus]ELB87519.1 hypothetical protein Rwratislav_39495 [Rhodococcus wratislaviensis IFP 2016]MDX5962957.1 hypothetical protein [Rhodococcus opacus]NKY69830.1 hypothetical protein [Rhodococcus opacus]CAG7599845.1 hypothetical protein E143388_04795 [Rhodococcus opacus]
MGYRLALANTSVPAGNVVANTVTKTTFADTAIVVDPNIDINTDNGRLFSISGYGYVSSMASSPGTLAISIVYNNTGSVTNLGTMTFTLPTSLANAGFEIDGFVLLCVAGTATARLSCQAFGLIDNAGAPISAAIVNTGTGTTNQVQPTNGTQGNQNMTVGLAAQFSVANAANSITLSQLIVESKA